MDAFSTELNTLLVDTFYQIMRVEEETVRRMKNSDLSISEVHVIESIAKPPEGRRTISDIAQDLNVSLPSVTVSVNKLVRKGYVEKARSADDGRQVLLRLTDAGQTINYVHRYFHEQMVRNVSSAFSSEEREVLLRAMRNLNNFFQKHA